MLGLDRINLHPGSCGAKESGIDELAQEINRIHSLIPDVIIVLETMAECQSKTTLGTSFSELAEVAKGIIDKARFGICVDTQHTFAG